MRKDDLVGPNILFSDSEPQSYEDVGLSRGESVGLGKM